MNKTQQLLKEREETFKNSDVWKEILANGDLVVDPQKLKSFHATTISLLLNSIKEEVEGKKKYIGDNPMCESCGALERPCLCYEYNQALSDISTLLSETISNIKS